MKMIKVVVERWLEVPDEWELVEPEYTDQLHIRTEDHCIVPELTWMVLKDHSEETCGWEEAPSDFKDRLGNMMTAGAGSMAYDSDMECDNDE